MSCWEQLGLPKNSSADTVEAKWKELRSTHHPDKGGDAATFHELNIAYQQALHEASQPKPCSHCNGTGKAEVRRGFGRLELMCSFCNGLGVEE